MQPENPEDAQLVFIEYARVLERDIESDSFPVPDDKLPFSKPIIKTAIKTSVQALVARRQWTDELREYFESAYVSLADYIAADLVRLMKEYARAGEELAADHRLAREKTSGAAWRTVAEGGQLAGEIARSMAAEAQQLRSEFLEFQQLMV